VRGARTCGTHTFLGCAVAEEARRAAHTSINPIDVAMSRGYGRSLWGRMRSEPTQLGRDCVGTIEAVGDAVLDWKASACAARGAGRAERHVVQVGDDVVAASTPLHVPGCLADLVNMPASNIAQRPTSLNDAEAGKRNRGAPARPRPFIRAPQRRCRTRGSQRSAQSTRTEAFSRDTRSWSSARAVA
jgi:hypothetical protein